MPCCVAALTRCSRLRSNNRESVGCATALGATVVSTITVLKLAARSNPPRLAAATVAASNSSTPASPKRLRQRVRLDGSIGGSVCKYVSPVNTCQYGFSTQPHTTSSSERSNACCRYSKPAINRGDVAGRPRCEVNPEEHTDSI